MKSRSELKREATAMQKLGEQLINLNSKQLAQLNLSQPLVAAIKELKTITSRAAKRRLSQYVGKLMREVDPEPIKKFLNELHSNSHQQKAEIQIIEKWRERLLGNDKAALTDYLNLYKHADAQKLRQLIAAAKRVESPLKAKTATRELFRYLKMVASSLSKLADSPEDNPL